jgi:hypothetical protein
MATIYKCDSCNKVLQRDKSLQFSVSDMYGVIKGGSFYSTFHFCEKCAGKIVKPLVKAFPAIKK